MFNTMTITKAAGALIGSLLFLLLVSWGASGLYHVGPTGHVAEGEEHPQAYSIAVEEAAPAGAEAEAEVVDINALLASADPAAGGVGPYVDLALRGCSKVIDGNVVPSRLDVYSQGTYVASPNEYHALIAIDEESLGDRTPFTVNSNLTCLKRVK